ncbi:hypothetical protein AC578_4766 [Pseudocercospora eumusae]|uniref:Uncharacterized protein n=1 Tax=Pseudocercospora eumusae TaxID=321146 RepID=A0A139HL32_9PEZI|nr:hypothetical protein AC578_4766 [Pseudocercospora eumusae]
MALAQPKLGTGSAFLVLPGVPDYITPSDSLIAHLRPVKIARVCEAFSQTFEASTSTKGGRGAPTSRCPSQGTTALAVRVRSLNTKLYGATMRLLSFPPALREAVELQIQRLQSKQLHPGSGDTDQLLRNEKEPPANLPQHRLLNHQSKRTGTIVLIAGFLLIILAASHGAKRISSTAEIHVPGTRYSPGQPSAEDHYLQIILPTQLNTTESCKTLLTGAVLNYPSPWVVNWQEQHDEQGNMVDPTLAKLESIFNLLKDKSPKHENDTAVVLANANVWFQLRPEVLLSRYWDLQHAETQSLKKNYDDTTLRMGSIKPKVLITAQNACQSMHSEGSGCIAFQAPDKPPRYISHSLLIGKFSDLRIIYRHAVARARAALAAHEAVDEHSIFAHLYSQQESHRKSLPKRAALDIELDHDHETYRKDFGLYADSSGSLSYTASTNSLSDEATWVHHDPLKGASKNSLPKDISSSPPPFWTIFGSNPKWSSRPWTSVPFLMNKSANKIPALIQRAADADPSFASVWYERLWFHPHGRELLDHYAFTLYVPSAILRDKWNGDKEMRFWPPVFAKPGFETDDNKFQKWANKKGEGICGKDVADSEQIFLDGRGEWLDPRP